MAMWYLLHEIFIILPFALIVGRVYWTEHCSVHWLHIGQEPFSNVRKCWLAMPLSAGFLCWVLACRTIEKINDRLACKLIKTHKLNITLNTRKYKCIVKYNQYIKKIRIKDEYNNAILITIIKTMLETCIDPWSKVNWVHTITPTHLSFKSIMEKRLLCRSGLW